MDSEAKPTQSQSPASDSVQLIRTALKAALATSEAGHPYASLVLVATNPDGSPILLISKLAVHTKNLDADARASLLFDGTQDAADPLTGARVSVRGRLARTSDPGALRRFLARHPSARGYAGFPDFSPFLMQIEKAHYVGGFGKIVDVPSGDLTLDLQGAEALLAAEADIIAHMNADHADANRLYATRLAGEKEGDWRMSGIDPTGFDLVCGPHGARISFDRRVTGPQEARQALVALVQRARQTE